MKYKVMATVPAVAGDAGFNFSFYTRAQAEEFCNTYRAIAGAGYAFLWDGSTWTTYAPVP